MVEMLKVLYYYKRQTIFEVFGLKNKMLRKRPINFKRGAGYVFISKKKNYLFPNLMENKYCGRAENQINYSESRFLQNIYGDKIKKKYDLTISVEKLEKITPHFLKLNGCFEVLACNVV